MDKIIHENREEKFEDTKGATRSRISKNRQHNGKKDTKGTIRSRISKNRQHNGQTKKYKRTNNDQQSIHIKLKIE